MMVIYALTNQHFPVFNNLISFALVFNFSDIFFDTRITWKMDFNIPPLNFYCDYKLSDYPHSLSVWNWLFQVVSFYDFIMCLFLPSTGADYCFFNFPSFLFRFNAAERSEKDVWNVCGRFEIEKLQFLYIFNFWFHSARMKSRKKFNLMSMQIANETSAECMWGGWNAEVAGNWD